MTTKSFFGLIIGFSIVLISCKKEVPAVEKSAVSETNTAVADSVQPIKSTTETAAPALNPPHGQPNHRCDIAVGAPLNSPSNQNQNQPIQIQPVQTQQAPVGVTNTNPANVKPKLNPPHGQPHHRCELAVGAPLPNV